MQQIDQQVFASVKMWLETADVADAGTNRVDASVEITNRNSTNKNVSNADVGRSVHLCTVLETFGSAPRPVGSVFATNGLTTSGSISGGCIEADFVRYLQQGGSKGLPTAYCYDYGTADGVVDKSLPCGGRIRLLIERLSRDALGWITDLLSAVEQQQALTRHIRLASGQVTLTLHLNSPVAPEPKMRETVTQISLHYPIEQQLLIIGASLVAQEVCLLASRLGYRCQVCDHREDFINNWALDTAPFNITLNTQSADSFIKTHVNAASAVLALAHDPRLDDLALLEALHSPAFYVGAMGAKKTSLARRERLQQLGVADAALARLHAPIGLAIGSKTPSEIAIAIVAELIAYKNTNSFAGTTPMLTTETPLINKQPHLS